MRVLLVAVLLVACGKGGKQPPRAGSGAGSAGSGACSEAELIKRVEGGFAGTERYFGEIEKRIGGWSDCEVARKDLEALEPYAKGYEALVTEQHDWMAAQGRDCLQRLSQIGDARAKANGMAQRFTPMLEKLKEVVARCKDHPGFVDAQKKGLRLLKKRRP